MQSVIFVLPYPVSANRYWATRIVKPKGRPAMAMTYVTPEARAFKEEVQRIVREAGMQAPITGRVQIDIRLYPHRPKDWQARQRKHGAAWDDTVQCLDLDNVNKVLLDSLKDVVMADDKFVRRIISERMEPDHRGARVLIRVTAIPTEQPQQEIF